MRKLVVFFLVLMTFCISTQSHADQPTLTKYEAMYRRANKLEQYRLYHQASAQYQDIDTHFNKKVAQEGVSKIPAEYFPFVISAVVRNAVITSQSQYRTFNKLVDQMDAFTESITQINQLLTIISDYNDTAATPVTKAQYAELFYARGLCYVAFSAKLLDAIAWKNYIVYPPNNVVQMLNFAMTDFRQVLTLNGMPIDSVSYQAKTSNQDPDGYQLFQDSHSKRLAIANAREFNTLRFINMEATPEKLAQLNARRNYYQLYRAIAFMQSNETQNTLLKSRSYYTLEKILAPDNQALFSTVTTLAGIVGLSE